MSQIWLALAVAGVLSPLRAQTVPPQPQTARQALIEMFMSKNQDDFAKHLPDAARQALIHKGETLETSFVLRIAMLGRGIAGQGEHIETFDVGPNILVSEQGDHHERLEVAVERDSFMGEHDEIELSVHIYKDGKEQAIPVIPRLIFTLTQEKDIWQLTELTVAAHVPLTDPEYLKGVRRQQNEANESAAQMRMNMIVAQQTSRAAAQRGVGYSCKLAGLMPQTDQSAAVDATTSANPEQPTEESNGYRFTISGCGGSPASKYRLTAVPIDPDSDSKTFCADESGKLRFVIGGTPASCFNRGQLVDATPQYPMIVD